MENIMGSISFEMALLMELFVTIHMSVFVFLPLSKIFGKDRKHELKVFLVLFILRAIILITCDIIGKYWFALIDFLFVFLGAFIIVPILLIIFKKKIAAKKDSLFKNTSLNSNKISSNMKCAKCGAVLTFEDCYCPDCGEKVPETNLVHDNSEEYYQSLIDQVRKKESK